MEESKVKVEQFADISKFKTAPRQEGMGRLWIATGERIKAECHVSTAKESGNIWLETTGAEPKYINLGKRFDSCQSMEPGYATIVANVMTPNADLTEEQLRSVEKKWGTSSTDNYRQALRDDLVQFHFAKEVEA